METGNSAKQFLEQLYLEMSPLLVRYAMTSLRDADAAEDLVQDVFTIACVKHAELAASRDPKDWLVRALKRSLRDYERDRVRAISAICRIIEEQREAAYGQEQLDLCGELPDTEDLRLLKRLYLERTTLKEIALQDGISLDACKKRVQRAKQRLKKQMENRR